MAVAIGKSSGVVRQLVMMFGVNKRDEYKRTPLMFAALGNNKSSSCSTLIDCGAEIDRQDICGLTALHVACYHGNKAAVSVLLNKGASVCKFDNTVSSSCSDQTSSCSISLHSRPLSWAPSPPTLILPNIRIPVLGV